MTLFLATTLWGAASAVLAQLGSVRGSAAPIISFGAFLFLATISWLGASYGERSSSFRLSPGQLKPFLYLGILEAINISLYAAALRLGSTFAVVALHLTSPIFLILFGLATRKRRGTAFIWIQATLIALAILLYGSQPAREDGNAQPTLAALLATGSAVAVAALIYTVSKYASNMEPDPSAALQLGVAAVLTSPLLLFSRPESLHRAVFLILAGAFLLGPGFALYWRAMRGLDASTASIIGLNEAVVAVLLNLLLFDRTISIQTAVSGFVIFTAIAIEFLGQRLNARRPG